MIEQKKKTNRFGSAPTIEEASNNLEQPEHAPAEQKPVKKRAAAKKQPAKNQTVRSVPFGQKVSPEFMKEFKQVALMNDLKLVELLEASLEAYKKINNS